MNNAIHPPQIGKHDLIEGLVKGIDVIRAFDAVNIRLTTSEIAERAGLSRAAARRYLLTLVHIGMATQERSSFQLTSKVGELGLHVHPVRSQAVTHQLLDRLTHQVQGTANVALVLLEHGDTTAAGNAAAAPGH